MKLHYSTKNQHYHLFMPFELPISLHVVYSKISNSSNLIDAVPDIAINIYS